MTERIVAALALLALLAAVPAAAMAADEGDAEGGLRIQKLDASQHPAVTLTVSVPGDVSGVELDAGAFTVTENGSPLRVVGGAGPDG